MTPLPELSPQNFKVNLLLKVASRGVQLPRDGINSVLHVYTAPYIILNGTSLSLAAFQTKVYCAV